MLISHMFRVGALTP